MLPGNCIEVHKIRHIEEIRFTERYSIKIQRLYTVRKVKYTVRVKREKIVPI